MRTLKRVNEGHLLPKDLPWCTASLTSMMYTECCSQFEMVPSEYRSFQYGDARGSVTEAPPCLESGIDREYLEKKEENEVSNSKKKRGNGQKESSFSPNGIFCIDSFLLRHT